MSLYKCPSCSGSFEATPYDIGSGPEVSCPNCETCFGADGQLLSPWDPVRSFTNRQELIDLLAEWQAWWASSDDAPAKLPNSLHVRTGVALSLAELDPALNVPPRNERSDVTTGKDDTA